MEKRKSSKKELIFDAACSLLVTKGYLETRIIDIAEKAGIGKGTVYEYFSSKEELFYQLFQERMETPANRIQEVSQMQCSSSEKLAAYIDIEMNVVVEAKELEETQQMPVDFLTGVELLKNDRIAESLRCIMESRIFLLKDILEEGIQKGEFYPVDPGLGAIAVSGAINFCLGLGMKSRFVKENENFSIGIEREEAQEQLLKLVLHGIKLER